MEQFSIFALAMAFGGGMFGAAIGGIPTFIMTGIAASIEGIILLYGVQGGLAGTYNIAFQIFVPNVIFIGAASSTAYAGRKGLLSSGSNMTLSAYSTGAPDALLVGGVFGALGYLLRLVFMLPAVVAVFPTDTPCAAAITLMFFIRLFIGKSGVTGNKKLRAENQAGYFATGKPLVQCIVLGIGFGCLSAGSAVALATLGFDISGLPVMFFGMMAITLIFIMLGLNSPATHHIAFLASFSVVCSLSVIGPSGALIAGIIVGVVSSLVGDFCARTFNSFHDSHIDPPAFTILILVPIINWIFV